MANLARLPRPVIESYEWQERGLCGAADIEMFFVPDDVGKRERTRRERYAKLLCARCPVMDRCRQHAFSAGERFGVWGGLSAHERQQLQVREEVA